MYAQKTTSEILLRPKGHHVARIPGCKSIERIRRFDPIGNFELLIHEPSCLAKDITIHTTTHGDSKSLPK